MDQDESFDIEFGESLYEATSGCSSRSITPTLSSVSGRCLRRPVVVKSK